MRIPPVKENSISKCEIQCEKGYMHVLCVPKDNFFFTHNIKGAKNICLKIMGSFSGEKFLSHMLSLIQGKKI
jgi:hypothetical protein